MRQTALFLFFLTCSTFVTAQSSDSYKKEIDSLTEKGNQFYFVQKDSAFYYFEEIYSLAASANDFQNTAQSLIDISDIAAYHNDLLKVKSSLEKLDALNASYDFTNEVEKIYFINSSRFGYGMYHYLIDDFKNSRKYFNGLIEDIDKLSGPEPGAGIEDLRSSAKSYISTMYTKEGKYDIASQHYRNNIASILSKNPVDQALLFGNYSLYGRALRGHKKYNESNKYLLKALKFNRENSKNKNRVISGAEIIATNYLDLKQIDSAEFYLDLIAEVTPKNHRTWYRYYRLKAELEKTKKNYSRAIENSNIALNLLKEKWGDLLHEQIIMSYEQIVDIHLVFNEPQNALNLLNEVVKRFDRSNGNGSSFLNLLSKKATALWKINTNNSFKECLTTVEKASQVFDSIKPSFRSTLDKLDLIESTFPLFESGLNSAHQLITNSKDHPFIDKAFAYAEKSKSIVLLEALLSAKATDFANIPKKFLERERQLKSEIAYFERKLNTSKQGDFDLIEDELFGLKEEHRNLISKIENQYKAYFDLKYNTQFISLPEAQNLLEPDEKLISYFYGNDAIYAIAVDNSSKQLLKIPLNASLINSLKRTRQMLADSKSDAIELGRISQQTYQAVVAPLLTSGEKKKLIIIPDGLLNYIPFGALNTSIEGLSYLTEHHSISYVNSATLYEQLSNRDRRKGELLAFAPKFSGEQVEMDPSRDKLLPLPHNKREVEQILTSFDGKSFINENATLQNFSSQLSNYNTVHLATHAVFNDDLPEYSYLAFSAKDKEENLLYVSDLYNLQINADLVTLSACESGIGELKRGEGFLSLARGFFYSGASSIASTLWKVNDASTATLMGSFYQNLAKGDTKDLALQKAKKTFLYANRQNGLSHPYYWSGFIISGNTAALTSPNDWFWIVGLGLLLSVFAGFLLFKKKTS